MKKLKLFFALFAMLALNVGNAWGETVTLNNLGAGLTATSNTSVSTTKVGDYTLNYLQGKKQGNSILLAKGTNGGTSFISNKTPIPGAIQSVTVYINTGAAGKTTYHCAFSTTECASKYTTGSTAVNITGGNSNKYTCSVANASYFCISLGNNNNGQVLKLEIEYTPTSSGGSTEPVLSATPTEIDFGTVYEGATVADKTVAVNFANLTGNVTYSGLSTPFSATGAISATGDEITISADASTIGKYSQTLTIASTADSKTAEVTVKMNVVEKPAPTGTFTLHTGELIEGDYVIYYSGKAMKAEVASNRLQYVEVTPSNNEIVDPAAAAIWHIAKSGANWTVYNNNKGYAAGTGTKSQAGLVPNLTGDNANKAAWTVTASGNAYEFVNVWNKSKSVNANLRNNTTYGFACYATSTGGALSLYRKAGTKYNVTVSSATNGSVTASPTSAEAGATIALTVTPDAGYVLDALTVTDASSNTIEVADNKFTMPASDVTVVATFKLNEKPAATLTLSKNGIEETFPGSWKQDDVVTLPSITSDCVKEFVGWSANPTCNVEPEYKVGDEYTLASTTQTLYAVYADEKESTTTEEYTFTSFTSAQDVTLGSTSFRVKLQKGTGSTNPAWNSGSAEARIYAKGLLTIVASKPIVKVVYTYAINKNNSGKQPTIDGVAGKNNAGTWDADTKTWNGSDTEIILSTSGDAGNVGFKKIVVTLGSIGYENYSTTCAAAPIATIDPTSVTATAAGANDKVEVTYENVNTANVAVALYNDEACTEAFTDGWLTAALDGDKITYTVAENTTYAKRKAYIKLTAPETNGATDPAVVVIPVTQAGKDKVFASLEALLAAITPTTEGVEVTVTLTNEVIQDFYKSSSYTNGIALNVPYEGGVKVIEIYCKDVPAEWVKGGKVSGTITCPWKLYNSTWELCPTAWTELTYTAPATVSSIAVSGTPTKTTYIDGEKFDPAGLVVTATYSDASTGAIDAALVDWTFDPATLVKGQTSVKVTAKFNSVSSAAYEVTGLTVNDIPTKTVAEFIAAEGGRCYLEGIVSGLTEGNSMKYGNFDLTDASGKIYVYGCLNAAGESQKFADLGVKNGDKIKVIADEYELYGGTTEEAKNVQYVSHVSAASITIADITMEVEEVKTISATVVPAEAEVTYTIKENTDNAISLSGNKITALAVGTATITASVAEGADYLANSVDFTVTVNPQNIATLPFAFDDGVNDIKNTLGMSQKNLGTDYGSSPKLKFDDKDDYVIVHFDSEPGALSYTIKANVNSGDFTGGFDVQVSENGDDYDVLVSYTELEKTAAQKTHKLDKNVRYVKFVYTNKVSGQNVALGNILISKLSVLRADLYDGKWGTLCPDQKVTYMQGASFYTLTYLEMKDGMPYKLFFDEITTNYLEAGKPYLFIAEGEKIKGVKSGEVVNDPSNYNGFCGNVSGNTILLATTQTEYVADGDVVNYYGVINSRFTLLGDRTTVAHERAYVQIKNGQLDCPNPPASLPALAPGARRVVAGATGINTATGVDQVQGDNVSTKMIINGQLFILRGEKMYNAQGKLVK